MLQSVGESLAFLHRHGAVHAETGTFGVVIHAIRQRLSSVTPTGYIGNQPEIFGWSAVAKGWGILISAAGKCRSFHAGEPMLFGNDSDRQPVSA